MIDILIMNNKLGGSGMKTILIVVGVIVVCIILFLIFDKMTPYDTKTIVGDRLKQGLVDEKIEITPEEKILDSVNTNRSRIVKIYFPSQDSESGDDKKFLAKGIIYSDDGVIVTSRGYFQEDISYAIEIPGRKELVVTEPTMIGEQFVTFEVDGVMPLVAQIDKSKLSKGDMVVAIGGQAEDTMATGEIFLVDDTADGTFIVTTIPASSVEIGAPLINTEQKVIGLYLKESVDGKAVFVATEDIDKIVKK